MKVIIKRASLHRALGSLQRLFFAGAFLMLGYYGYVQVNARMFQHREERQFDRLLRSTELLPVIAADGLIGRIEIPRLNLSAVVIEGTSDPVLRRAAGHIVGTGLPGQPGNVGIAAHRDTLFRPLRNIHRDDEITLTTVRGQYRYRVVSTKIVNPNNVGVLAPDGSEILTLVTCYPFYFVGAAPNRFIVRAERMGSNPRL